ncbi:hypothetical protein AMR41_06025 [Hapalosiphon sp. MRB220]|nr:hypothetical protein AMR41_06025 [Hapalosiphon sp. MRB220]
MKGTGNREQGTDGFRWGFIPHLKHTTYRSGGLLLPESEQEIGKTVPCSLFPVPSLLHKMNTQRTNEQKKQKRKL